MNIPEILSQSQLACSPEEAARRLGLGRNLTYRLIRDKQLRSVRAGRRILVPLAAIEAFLAGEP